MQNLTKPNGLCQMTELLNSNEAHLDYQKAVLSSDGGSLRLPTLRLVGVLFRLGACHLPQPEVVLISSSFENDMRRLQALEQLCIFLIQFSMCEREQLSAPILL